MGKAIIITALGVSLIVTALIMNLNANTNEGLATTVEFYEDTQARLIANSGVEIYLEKLRRDKKLTGNFLDNELLDGTYKIYIWGPDTALNIKSVATFNGKTHTSRVRAARVPVGIPPVNGAMYISSDVLTVDMGGNVKIDGHDHDINGGLGGPYPDLPGIAVDTPADSAYIIDNIKPKVSNNIEGFGGSPSVRSVVDNVDWYELTEAYVFAADTTLVTGIYNGGYFGTFSTPKITYVTGNVKFNGSAEGYGVLVINGNVTFNGNFTFHGIIIAYSHSTLETNILGNTKLFGATILVGEEVELDAASGSAEVYYSSEAIENAKVKLKSSRFNILSWWE
jgi:hypothetical protein